MQLGVLSGGLLSRGALLQLCGSQRPVPDLSDHACGGLRAPADSASVCSQLLSDPDRVLPRSGPQALNTCSHLWLQSQGQNPKPLLSAAAGCLKPGLWHLVD